MDTYRVAADSLTNYYKQWDIPVYIYSEEDKIIGPAFKELVTPNYRGLKLPVWYAAVTARMSLLNIFLESDHDYFIMQDLDYLVARPDMNIREKINHDFIANHWSMDFWLFCDMTKEQGHQYNPELRWLYAQKYNNTLGIIFSDNGQMRGQMRELHTYCADMMIMSRETVEKIVAFFKDRQCDFTNPHSFNVFTKSILHQTVQMFPSHIEDQPTHGIQEEDFFAAYVQATKHIPVFLNKIKDLKRDFWNIKTENDGWVEGFCNLMDMINNDKRFIFIHLGNCDKEKFFPRVSRIFRC